MTWQPIETAPLDGTEILVWSKKCKTSGYGEIAEAGLYRAAYIALPEDRPTKRYSYWCNADRRRYAYDNYVLKPTHWMPLPTPPAPVSATSPDQEQGEG